MSYHQFNDVTHVCLHITGDDSVLQFNTADMKAIEIISQINRKTKSL